VLVLVPAVLVAAGEELVLVVCHLILLKAHSHNLRHNNIGHREIV